MLCCVIRLSVIGYRPVHAAVYRIEACAFQEGKAVFRIVKELFDELL